MRKKILQLASLIFLFILWQICGSIIDAPIILPKPKEVFFSLIEILGQTSFWLAFLVTVLRCFLSFFITMILGTVLGILCGLYADFYSFLEIPMAIIRSTPVVSFILIAIFWLKSGTIPVFISVVMTLPIIITAIYTGFGDVDKNLLKMAKVFNFTKMQILTKIQLPEIKNPYYGGMLSVFGLTWKVVAAGEVLSLPRFGIGTMLQRSQVHLESAEIIAITIFYIAVSFVLGKLPAVFVRQNHLHQNPTR